MTWVVRRGRSVLLRSERAVDAVALIREDIESGGPPSIVVTRNGARIHPAPEQLALPVD